MRRVHPLLSAAQRARRTRSASFVPYREQGFRRESVFLVGPARGTSTVVGGRRVRGEEFHTEQTPYIYDDVDYGPVGTNPELLIVGNPCHRRRRNHPFYRKSGKDFRMYAPKAGQHRIPFNLYHGIPGVDPDWVKVKHSKKKRKSGKQPYIKMGGKRYHMKDLVKKYRSIKKAASVYRAHRKYKGGKVWHGKKK